MTYNVFGGTLNLTQPLVMYLKSIMVGYETSTLVKTHGACTFQDTNGERSRT